MPKHRRQHVLAVFQNIIVPKPQNVEAIQFQRSRAHLIVVHTISMLTTIELDDKLCFKTHKIGNKTEHRKLSPKFMSRQLPST